MRRVVCGVGAWGLMLMSSMALIGVNGVFVCNGYSVLYVCMYV